MKSECKIDAYGTKNWYLNNLLHREDGPAVEHDDGGLKKWYLNNLLHREDGPAVELSTGYKAWYINGKLHREDGPAIENPIYGHKAWAYHGKQIYCKNNEEFLRMIKLIVFL